MRAPASTYILVVVLSSICFYGTAWAQSPNPSTPTTAPVKAAVRTFYGIITKYQPLGTPKGKAKQALWPLLSSRLARQLDTLQACEDNYYRRYGKILREQTLKPSIAWLELGLFSGGDEAAGPSRVAIVKVSPKSAGSFAVHIQFWHLQTYSADFHHPSQEDGPYEGIVTVVLEGSRYLVDDFMVLDNDSKKPVYLLSHGFDECRGGKWVGRVPY